MIISVDPGKGFTKYCYEGKDGSIVKDKFITKYSQVERDGGSNIPSDQALRVVYKDKEYEIGIQGKHDLRSKGTDKKFDEHRLATLVAITQALQDKGVGDKKESINLVLSMPAGSFKGEHGAEKYREFFLGDDFEDININVNGVNYNYGINDILVQPEGRGYAINNSDDLEGLQMIVDMGHLNTQFILLENGNVVDMITIEMGGRRLENLLEEKYNSDMGDVLNTRYHHIILKNGYASDDAGVEIPNSKEVISEVKQDFLTELVDEIKEVDIELGMQQSIIFIGGTSLILEDAIMENDIFKNRAVISENGVWDTVTGNLLTGYIYFDNEDDTKTIEDDSEIDGDK